MDMLKMYLFHLLIGLLWIGFRVMTALLAGVEPDYDVIGKLVAWVVSGAIMALLLRQYGKRGS